MQDLARTRLSCCCGGATNLFAELWQQPTSGRWARWDLAAGYGMSTACTMLLAATTVATRRLWLPPARGGEKLAGTR